MVFESLVVDLMNKYLGTYIENLDASQLKLGIWGGDAVLENLHVKGDALKDLDLPVTVKSGFIGKLTLKIPWKNLYKDAVTATLESLYILAVPNSSVEYNEEAEKERLQKEKQDQLQEIEEQMKKKMEAKDSPPKQDGFVEKLATQVIKNIQVHVKNIHIRYEDENTIPGQPFAMGVTLHSLDVQTTDEHWMPTLLDESVKVIYKMVGMKALSVYWNSAPKLLFSKIGRDEQLREFKETISNGDFLPDHFTYIIKPIMMDVKLRLNPHPENDMANPKVLLSVILQELSLHLSRCQYHDVMELVESLDRMSINAPFAKFKPKVPAHGNAKLWWKYAYNGVLEAGVSRKMKMFSWKHIKEHRRKLRAYKKLYKEKLKQKKPPKDLVNSLIEMENEIDVFNITLARQSAEAELAKSGVTIKSKKSAHQKEEQSSWFGGWFGGGKKKPKEEKKEEDKGTIDSVIDENEKKLLYEAIGYSEGESPTNTNFPKDYVEVSVGVQLKKVAVTLKDDKNLGGANLLKLLIDDIDASFKQRPSAKAIAVQTAMRSFTVDGLEENGICPHIISSNLLSEENIPVSASGVNLLSVQFETNPLDEMCDQRICLTARPLQIIYDSTTINNLIEFFTPPEHIQLQQIKNAAAFAYEDIVEQTSTGLSHIMETRAINDIDIKLMSSFVVMPKDGKYSDGCEALVLDLGEVELKSLNEGITPASRANLTFSDDNEENLERFRAQAYDKFTLEINKVQLLLAGKDDDWVVARSLTTSPLHVLEPMNLFLKLQKSIVLNDANLPKLKVDGELPLLSVKISDKKLHCALQLANSIPLPPPGPDVDAVVVVGMADWNLDEDRMKRKEMKQINNVFEDSKYASTPSLSSTVTNSSDEFFTAESDMSDIDEVMTEKLRAKKLKHIKQHSSQLTDVKASFNITRICVGVAQNTTDGDREILNLSIENFGVSAAVRTWDTEVSASLGAIYMEYMQGKLPDGSPMYILNSPKQEVDLLQVHVLIAKRTAPEFSTAYKNTEQSLKVDFSQLEVNANSKALLEIKDFAEKLVPPAAEATKISQTNLTTPKGSKSTLTLVTPNESVVSAVPDSEASKDMELENKRAQRRKSKSNTEITNLRLEVILESFALNLSEEKRKIASVAIEGIETEIAMMPSRISVAAKLRNLLVIDPLPESIYHHIIRAEGEDVLSADIVNYNDATSGEGYANMENVDTSVSLKLSSLRVVFVKRFIDTLVKFGSNFQDAKEVALEAGAMAQEAASKSIVNLVERNPRIRLDVNLSVPKIFIPRNSKSLEVLSADLGNVKVSNHFTIVGAQGTENPAVCEAMQIEVTDIGASLCQLNETHSVETANPILDPVSLSANIQRNLAVTWFHDVPDIMINGTMNTINVKLSGPDLKLVLSILNENMAEIEEGASIEEEIKSVEVSNESHPASPAETRSRRNSQGGVIGERSKTSMESNDVWETLKLNFDISSFHINLYSDQERKNQLALFTLRSLGLNVGMKSDSSMDVQAQLKDILLKDARPTHQQGITKLVERKLSAQQSPDSLNNAIHASLSQNSDGSMIINTSVGSLRIILCLEFILKVTDLILNSFPQVDPEPVVSESAPALKETLSSESLLSDTTIVAPTKPHEPEPSDVKSKAIHIDFKLYQPDIILVTDMMSKDSEALVLGMKLKVNIEVSQDGKEQKMAASLTELQLLNCPFASVKNITSEHKKVIAPCDITVNAALSETMQDLSVAIDKIRITATPTVIQTITDAVAVLSPQSQSETSLTTSTDQVEKYENVWARRKISDMHLWYIEKPEEELKAKGTSMLFGKVSSLHADKPKAVKENLALSIPDIRIKLESGRGHHTVPLLVTEMKVNGNVKNWSAGEMQGKFTLSLGVVYFNEYLSVWEPLVEPVETDPGEMDSKYELWTLEAEIKQNPTPKGDEMVDSFNSSMEEELPPLMAVSVSSQKILHTTISHAALKVINSLARAFADAAISKTEKKKGVKEIDDGHREVSAEVKINNMLNVPLRIKVGPELVVVGNTGEDKNAQGEYMLNYKEYLALDFAAKDDLGIRGLLMKQHEVHDENATQIQVCVPGNDKTAVFDVSKTGTTLTTLRYKDKDLNVVCVIVSKGGIRTVTLRSSLMINNHLSIPLEIIGAENEVVDTVKPNESLPLLRKYIEDEKLFVRPTGDHITVSKHEIEWKQLINSGNFQSAGTIRCAPTKGTSPVNMNIEVIQEQVHSLSENDTCYEIHVRPVLLFRNYLPFKVEYTIGGIGQISKFKSLEPGTGMQVFNASMRQSHLKVKIPEYKETSWIGSVALETGVDELTVWTFKDEKNEDKVMVMGKQITYIDGYMKITLYSPYWMVNETGFPLDYKAGDDNIVQHPQEKQDFILFSFTSKAFLSKNKLQLRICNSNFSDSFSIDAVGSNGTIICKTKAFNYIVGTKITLTSFGLTKIVTFSSYYSIVNKTNEDMEILEVGGDEQSLPLAANSSCLFWPESKTDQFKIRLKGDKDSVSTNIRYSKLDSGVLVKVGEIPFFVDVSVSESAVIVTIKNYYVGSSAVLLVNHTNDLKVSYSQAKLNAKHQLESGFLQHYLWPEPTSRREISWKIEEGGKETTHDVLHELAGQLKFKVNNIERVVHYAVFVDGLQRVLLITENKRCADAVEQGLGMERPNMEVSIALQGLSCSIVDMNAKREVMYMAITSSGIVWEEKPKKRWTTLALRYSSALEGEYQRENQTSGTIEVEKYEFDVGKMKIIKPYKGEIRRFFSPGIWLQYTVSDHQQMVHAKINRLQIDNQLPAAVFPVILHPIPLPKTVAIDSSPKPFVEFSLMQRTSEHQNFTHIKYFKALVQEFSIKLDMGFISAILPVFGADKIKTNPERELKYFNYDIAMATKAAQKDEDIKDDSGIAFYDMLHLSPIKVHVSFSMQNTCNDQGEQSSKVVVLPFNALAVVLKSVGVTVSDIDDVVFKLGYFERQYQFFNSSQFQNAVTLHYAGQAIKQLYVLVFGLDVIGNPYGLVMGIAEGVTDLFYEPYQGMIQGPGEFVEGLALGAMSLLGHTVGGAAGAVSRVTGALGKGIATMTMDDEYKKKRQMQKNKPTDLKEGLTRGGKGLVMGVVGGLTGVVTKPVEGAKKEGAAGFFKGVGKGIIGIVARPASGVIDLASNTFEGIQKLADMSEDVKRMRPARWIDEGTGILTPYKLKRAQGNALLFEVEKGKYAENAKYVDHVPIDKNKKSFLMLTTKMIFEIHIGDLFGQWNSAWKFDYTEIVEEPHLTKDGIKLVGAKTKKMFGSKSHTRVVTFSNQAYADHILKQMKLDWSSAQKGKSAVGKESKHRGHALSFSRKSKH